MGTASNSWATPTSARNPTPRAVTDTPEADVAWASGRRRPSRAPRDACRAGPRPSPASLRRRHAHSYAIATVAAVKDADGTRIGITGVGPRAVRARSVEASGNAEDVLEDVEPIDDAVASAAYRRTVLPKLVREALDQLERA